MIETAMNIRCGSLGKELLRDSVQIASPKTGCLGGLDYGIVLKQEHLEASIKYTFFLKRLAIFFPFSLFFDITIQYFHYNLLSPLPLNYDNRNKNWVKQERIGEWNSFCFKIYLRIFTGINVKLTFCSYLSSLFLPFEDWLCKFWEC